MQKINSVQAGIFNPRVLTAFSLCSAGLFLAMFSFATPRQPARSVTSSSGQSAAPAAPASMGGPTTSFSNGITFEHATWNDPIRMVGEPDIVIDHNNGIYVSGPGGSTTQASWFWKSTDKGLQWHLIGCPLKSNCQNGGGDTEITVANNNDVFASDLQTLTCNSALHSYDQGNTWMTGEGCFPGTDRQWMGNYDPNASASGRRVYLSANGQAQGCYFLVSTDNGVTYTGTDLVNNPTAVVDQNNGEGCIGRFAVNQTNGHIYVPGDGHTWVSTDGGVTFVGRPQPSGIQGNFFANIAIDTAGNLWQGWTTGCGNPATSPCKAFVSYSTNEAQSWSTPIQVNTGVGSPAGTSPDLRQMLFPWTVVGDPGRVAIVYYATTDTQQQGGFPGGVNALWNTYVSISTNAMAANPTWTQVQVDEHTMHRATVCTGGFPGCLTANSDRSMADFFAVDKDSDGRVYVAYNENSDLSDVTQTGTEYIGKPINAVIRLRTGPSLFAAKGNLLPDPKPANIAITSSSVNGGSLQVQGTHGLPPGNWATDQAGDALFPVVPVASANHPALDILETSISDDGTNLTFNMKMADLSAAALADAATSGGTPSWMVVWWEKKNGLGPATMTSETLHSHWFVKWLGQNQFVYGKVGSIDSAALGAPTPKALTYVPMGTGTAVVNGNLVTMTVPLANVGPLAIGDKIDHIIAYSLVEHADATLSDWADQAKSFSYIIGTPAAGQHAPDGYIQVSTNNFATSTIATINNANNTWTASLPVSSSGTVCARQVLAKDLYTTVWDDVQAGPTTCANFSVPMPSSVVSRKVQGSGTFDINMPLVGTRGVECRSGGATKDYTIVFTFPAALTSVGGAVVTNHDPVTSTGQVFSSGIGTDPTQYIVNLTQVSTGQYLTITLNNVLTGGVTGNVISPQIGILVGDVDASGRVDSTDVFQVRQNSLQNVNSANFRTDIDESGRIDSTDVFMTRQNSLMALPTAP